MLAISELENKLILLRGVSIQKVCKGRIVEHSGGSNSLEVLLELGFVKWTIDQKEPSSKAAPQLRESDMAAWITI
jgi:hypothetical protein